MAKLLYNRTKKVLETVGANIVGKVQFQMGQANASGNYQSASGPSNATGKTSASIKYHVKQKGPIISVGITSRKRLNQQVLYIIDKGREPGLPPPYKEIAKWIRAKNIPIRGSNKGAGAINRAAYGIAQSIGRYGITPRNIFDKALSAYKPIAENQILNALGEDLDEFIDENMPDKT